MAKRKTTRDYYVAIDASAVRARYDEILAEEAKTRRYSDPLLGLAKAYGIALGPDLKSTGPLKNLLAGKRVTGESRDLFERTMGLTFRPVPIAVEGRRKRSQAIDDMRKNGARYGIVPCDLLTNKTDGTLGMVPLAVEEALKQHGIQKTEARFMANRDVRRELQAGLHFAIGVSLTADNKSDIKIVRKISRQKLALLVAENAVPGDRRKIGIIVGSGEESIIRELKLDQSRIVGHSFDDPLLEHRKLFERVQSGELIGAISTLHAVSSWMTLHWRPIGLLARLIQYTIQNGDASSDFHSLSGMDTQDAMKIVTAKAEPPLAMVSGKELDQWLAEHLDLAGAASFSKFASPFGIAISKRLSPYKYDCLESIL